VRLPHSRGIGFRSCRVRLDRIGILSHGGVP